MMLKQIKIMVVPKPACCAAFRSSLDRKVIEVVSKIKRGYSSKVDVREANAFFGEQIFHRKIREQKPTIWQKAQMS